MNRFAALVFLLVPWALADDGSSIYAEYCSVCHGDSGDGKSFLRELDPPPRDFTSPSTAAQLTRGGMIDAVRNGRPGTAMAAWSGRLSQDQIEAVVDYVRTAFLPAEDALVAETRATYKRLCESCHGADGRGAEWARTQLTPPPADLSRAGALPRERMVAAVTHGRPQTAMVGWETRLSGAEIERLVDWIRTNLARGSAPPTAPAHPKVAGRRLTEMPAGLEGDPRRGRGLYLANCVACHGVEGRGDGPRAYFVFPKPRDFTTPAVREGFDRARLYQATSDGTLGTEMPAWKWVLGPQELADIAEYLYQTHIAPEG